MLLSSGVRVTALDGAIAHTHRKVNQLRPNSQELYSSFLRTGIFPDRVVMTIVHRESLSHIWLQPKPLHLEPQLLPICQFLHILRKDVTCVYVKFYSPPKPLGAHRLYRNAPT